jgi:tRNA-dihydrouridine synthase
MYSASFPSTHVYQNLPRPFFALAPMDDVTDTVFRQVVVHCHPPELFFTEFINVEGLCSQGRDALLDKLRHSSQEKPLVAQLWGKDPRSYAQIIPELIERGFAGIDLNMGCPDKTILKKGCCAALINHRSLALEIIAACQEALAGRLPLSIKTRLGFNEVDLTWHELLLQQSLAALIIHARTKQDMSKTPARWEYFHMIREQRDKIAPSTLLIGNGDIRNRSHGEELAHLYGLDGIMIGRGIFQDPYAFANPSPWPTMRPKARMDLYRWHIECFIAMGPVAGRRLQTLNKFCKIYIQGFTGAKELREHLMKQSSVEELYLQLEKAYEDYA